LVASFHCAYVATKKIKKRGNFAALWEEGRKQREPASPSLGRN